MRKSILMTEPTRKTADTLHLGLLPGVKIVGINLPPPNQIERCIESCAKLVDGYAEWAKTKDAARDIAALLRKMNGTPMDRKFKITKALDRNE